jgi:hypothetical protein
MHLDWAAVDQRQGAKRHDAQCDMSGGPATAGPRHRDLLRLLDYWQEKRGVRDFPRRADIDPLDLGFMLDRIALTEVHGNSPRRYRLRLVGSWWKTLVGFESTGMWLDDWPHPNQRRITFDGYEALVIARRPLSAVRDVWVDDKKLSHEILWLPLSEDNSHISMIVSGIGPV